MEQDVDVLIVGGGINGAGIAREATGRGLRVALCERGDFGGETSSASSKLIHGGLRYLEKNQFRLVQESLREREILLRTAGHLVRPLRFVLPHQPALRPAWMIRAGLWLYDCLGGRRTLPGSRRENLRRPPFDKALQVRYRTGFSYSDCSVDDSRLVIAILRAAWQSGARILPRTACVGLSPEKGGWRARLRTQAGTLTELRARAIVNATGPWVRQFLNEVALLPGGANVKLVKGSHIVVPRKSVGDHAYLLQHSDQRIVFLIPYEGRFTLIGTTESAVALPASGMGVSEQECDYLLEAANRYLAHPVQRQDIVWRYAGLRALHDDGGDNLSAISRDYFLQRQTAADGAVILSVFGGKITTHRKLAEQVLQKLGLACTTQNRFRTDTVPLPGCSGQGFDALQCLAHMTQRYPGLPAPLIEGVVRRHGLYATEVLGEAGSMTSLGKNFGAGLSAREIDYFLEQEWARTVEDVVWRRSKTGLFLSEAEQAAVAEYIRQKIG